MGDESGVAREEGFASRAFDVPGLVDAGAEVRVEVALRSERFAAWFAVPTALTRVCLTDMLFEPSLEVEDPFTIFTIIMLRLVMTDKGVLALEKRIASLAIMMTRALQVVLTETSERIKV